MGAKDSTSFTVFKNNMDRACKTNIKSSGKILKMKLLLIL